MSDELQENRPFQFQLDSAYRIYIMLIQIIDLFYLKKNQKS